MHASKPFIFMCTLRENS